MTPSLARNARLRWDNARGTYVLLYPEGVLLLNAGAAEVLQHVDGVRALGAIVDAVACAHSDTARSVIEDDVHTLLDRLHARGFIAWSEP